MIIKYDNNDELIQILNILLPLGYKFHGCESFTCDHILDKYGSDGYTNVVVGKYSDKSYLTLNCGDSDFVWNEDFVKIMASLQNFKTEKSDGILIEGVGDYPAFVKKDEVIINREHITKEKLELIIHNINSGDVGEFSVFTENDKEHKTYMAMLYSHGLTYHDRSSFVEAHESFFAYPYTSYNRGYISGDMNKTLYKIYNFKTDLAKIYELLTKDTAIPPIGDYPVKIIGENVEVGCQRIPVSKVKEIYDTMIKLNS